MFLGRRRRRRRRRCCRRRRRRRAHRSVCPPTRTGRMSGVCGREGDALYYSRRDAKRGSSVGVRESKRLRILMYPRSLSLKIWVKVRLARRRGSEEARAAPAGAATQPCNRHRRRPCGWYNTYHAPVLQTAANGGSLTRAATYRPSRIHEGDNTRGQHGDSRRSQHASVLYHSPVGTQQRRAYALTRARKAHVRARTRRR